MNETNPMPERGPIDVRQIAQLLPHRYPFLLVDKIIDFQPGVSITGIKNVTINEPFFQGHFPGHPIMPGVLIVEAMAQKRAYVAAVKKALGATGFFSREVDQEAFRDEVAIEPEHPIKLIGAQPTPEKPIKSKSKTETRTDQDADWSTQFWARANSAGVKREDALPLADQANRGEITWEEAIKSLPN